MTNALFKKIIAWLSPAEQASGKKSTNIIGADSSDKFSKHLQTASGVKETKPTQVAEAPRYKIVEAKIEKAGLNVSVAVPESVWKKKTQNAEKNGNLATNGVKENGTVKTTTNGAQNAIANENPDVELGKSVNIESEKPNKSLSKNGDATVGNVLNGKNTETKNQVSKEGNLSPYNSSEEDSALSLKSSEIKSVTSDKILDKANPKDQEPPKSSFNKENVGSIAKTIDQHKANIPTQKAASEEPVATKVAKENVGGINGVQGSGSKETQKSEPTTQAFPEKEGIAVEEGISPSVISEGKVVESKSVDQPKTNIPTQKSAFEEAVAPKAAKENVGGINGVPLNDSIENLKSEVDSSSKGMVDNKAVSSSASKETQKSEPTIQADPKKEGIAVEQGINPSVIGEGEVVESKTVDQPKTNIPTQKSASEEAVASKVATENVGGVNAVPLNDSNENLKSEVDSSSKGVVDNKAVSSSASKETQKSEPTIQADPKKEGIAVEQGINPSVIGEGKVVESKTVDQPKTNIPTQKAASDEAVSPKVAKENLGEVNAVPLNDSIENLKTEVDNSSKSAVDNKAVPEKEGIAVEKGINPSVIGEGEVVASKTVDQPKTNIPIQTADVSKFQSDSVSHLDDQTLKSVASNEGGQPSKVPNIQVDSVSVNAGESKLNLKATDQVESVPSLDVSDSEVKTSVNPLSSSIGKSDSDKPIDNSEAVKSQSVNVNSGDVKINSDSAEQDEKLAAPKTTYPSGQPSAISSIMDSASQKTQPEANEKTRQFPSDNSEGNISENQGPTAPAKIVANLDIESEPNQSTQNSKSAPEVSTNGVVNSATVELDAAPLLQSEKKENNASAKSEDELPVQSSMIGNAQFSAEPQKTPAPTTTENEPSDFSDVSNTDGIQSDGSSGKEVDTDLFLSNKEEIPDVINSVPPKTRIDSTEPQSTLTPNPTASSEILASNAVPVSASQEDPILDANKVSSVNDNQNPEVFSSKAVDTPVQAASSKNNITNQVDQIQDVKESKVAPSDKNNVVEPQSLSSSSAQTVNDSSNISSSVQGNSENAVPLQSQDQPSPVSENQPLAATQDDSKLSESTPIQPTTSQSQQSTIMDGPKQSQAITDSMPSNGNVSPAAVDVSPSQENTPVAGIIDESTPSTQTASTNSASSVNRDSDSVPSNRLENNSIAPNKAKPEPIANATQRTESGNRSDVPLDATTVSSASDTVEISEKGIRSAFTKKLDSSESKSDVLQNNRVGQNENQSQATDFRNGSSFQQGQQGSGQQPSNQDFIPGLIEEMEAVGEVDRSTPDFTNRMAEAVVAREEVALPRGNTFPHRFVSWAEKSPVFTQNTREDVWHKQRLVLDNGQRMTVSVKKSENTMHIQLNASSGEIQKFLAQNINEIRAMLEERFDLQIDLQMQNREEQADQSSQNSNGAASNGASLRGLNDSLETNSDEAAQTANRVRRFGFNEQEWTA